MFSCNSSQTKPVRRAAADKMYTEASRTQILDLQGFSTLALSELELGLGNTGCKQYTLQDHILVRGAGVEVTKLNLTLKPQTRVIPVAARHKERDKKWVKGK